MTAVTPQPVFVLSTGRTGTTLLMKLLATSSDVWVPGSHPLETRLLTLLTGGVGAIAGVNGGLAVQAALEADPDASPVSVRFAAATNRLALPSALPAGADVVGGTLRGAWAGLCQAAGVTSRYYAEKSIGLSLPPGIEALDPRVINVIRDPRDIMVSVREFDKARGFSGFGRDMEESDESYAARAVDMYRTLLRLAVEGPIRRPDRQIQVRYEDLVTNRAGEALRLAEWLGVEIPADDVTEPGTHATSASPESSIGRWRTELAEPAVRVFADEIGDLLIACGYEV